MTPEEEDRRRQMLDQRWAAREFVGATSLGCPRRPISCGHMLVDHGVREGVDENYMPRDPRCRVPGCDCDGVS